MNDFWNNRYADAEFAYGTAPNQFLAEQLANYQLTGRALFAAEGEGRNAVYAAKSGLRVDAFDLSTEGKQKADRLAAVHNLQINYQTGEFTELNYEPATYDVLALIYAHFPADRKQEMNRQLAEFVKPGGLVIFEAFGSRHLAYRSANPAVGGPGAQEMLFSVAEIEETFADFEPLYLAEETVNLNEGKYHRGEGSVVRFVGRRR